MSCKCKGQPRSHHRVWSELPRETRETLYAIQYTTTVSFWLSMAPVTVRGCRWSISLVGLHTILFGVWAFVHESRHYFRVRTLWLGTPPHPVIVHTTAQYNISPRPPVIAIHTTQYWQWQCRVEANPVVTTGCGASFHVRPARHCTLYNTQRPFRFDWARPPSRHRDVQRETGHTHKHVAIPLVTGCGASSRVRPARHYTQCKHNDRFVLIEHATRNLVTARVASSRVRPARPAAPFRPSEARSRRPPAACRRTQSPPVHSSSVHSRLVLCMWTLAARLSSLTCLCVCVRAGVCACVRT